MLFILKLHTTREWVFIVFAGKLCNGLGSINKGYLSMKF